MSTLNTVIFGHATLSVAPASGERLYMVFDVESIGLHGEGFAVGWVIVGDTGREYEAKHLACPSFWARGTDENRAWIKKNVPEIVAGLATPRAVRDEFWYHWSAWKQNGAVLVADCAWPVEARFLAQCVDDDPGIREFNGPYPLLDVSSFAVARGQDPLETGARLPDELPAHHPLHDARQSARNFLWLLGRKVKQGNA